MEHPARTHVLYAYFWHLGIGISRTPIHISSLPFGWAWMGGCVHQEEITAFNYMAPYVFEIQSSIFGHIILISLKRRISSNAISMHKLVCHKPADNFFIQKSTKIWQVYVYFVYWKISFKFLYQSCYVMRGLQCVGISARFVPCQCVWVHWIYTLQSRSGPHLKAMSWSHFTWTVFVQEYITYVDIVCVLLWKFSFHQDFSTNVENE